MVQTVENRGTELANKIPEGRI